MIRPAMRKPWRPPYLRVVQHDKPALLPPAVEREWRAREWMYRVGSLAAGAVVLGSSFLIARVLVRLIRK